jgi:D-proline reductase (dithiol) PrdB
VTRLSDLPPAQAKRLAEVECPKFATTPFVSGPQLSQRKIAIVSSAGLFRRDPEPFRGRDSDYRVVRGDIAWEDLLTSHISVNFDRTGLQEDWNVAFPLDRMRELAAEGVIGALAGTHYSFVGAADPLGMEPHARELAGRLKQGEVDSVLLTPARRERARTLSGGGRPGDGLDQPDPAANREHPATARTVGAF